MRSRHPFLVLLLIGACECAGEPIPPLPDSGRIDTSDAGSTRRDRGIGGNDGICNNGLDDDDDGQVDEGCECEPGERQECYSGNPREAGLGVCFRGEQACESDFEFSTWGPCIGEGAPEDMEVCDGVDNNCDGVVDERCGCVIGEVRDCYSGPRGTLGVGSCMNGFERCFDPGTGPEWSGCEASITPEGEDCDGGDEDCDGRIDEGCACSAGDTRDCYGGPPGTSGVGECRAGRQRCSDEGWGECAGDTAPATEVCSGGEDEDCDGDIDCDDSDCDCCTAYTESAAVAPAEAELLFVIDRSGSMDFLAVGVDRTRWQELQSAIASVLPMVSDTPMGMLTFPELNGTSELGWCGVATTLDVPIASGTLAAIESRLVAADPRAGDTPTPDAFSTIENYLSSRSSSRETFVILATDGLPEPNCGATVPATVAAIEDLRTREGVNTFVIGIVGPDRDGDTSGIPALRSALNQFADAGGRPRSGSTRYYEAVDGAALTSAFRSILGEATECRFELGSTPPAGAIVSQDGATVPASGYTLSGRTLEFSGTFCSRIRAGLVTRINVRVDC